MNVTITCPGCGQSQQVPSESLQQKVFCSSCGRDLTQPQSAQPQAQGGYAYPPPYGLPGYGDEVYQQTFNLAGVDPAVLQSWRRWFPTSFSTAGAILLDIFTCGLFGLIFYGIKFSDLPKISRNDFGAGKGIGFCFIPYFNFYWIFRFWWGLCDRLNLQLRLAGQEQLRLSRDLATWVAILNVACVIPYLGMLVAVGETICREIFIGKMQQAINALAALQNPPAHSAPAYPPPVPPTPPSPPDAGQSSPA